MSIINSLRLVITFLSEYSLCDYRFTVLILVVSYKNVAILELYLNLISNIFRGDFSMLTLQKRLCDGMMVENFRRFNLSHQIIPLLQV